MNALKPCPFCGFDRVELHAPVDGSCAVVCTNCFALGPSQSTTAEAAERWNYVPRSGDVVGLREDNVRLRSIIVGDGLDPDMPIPPGLNVQLRRSNERYESEVSRRKCPWADGRRGDVAPCPDCAAPMDYDEENSAWVCPVCGQIEQDHADYVWEEES